MYVNPFTKFLILVGCQVIPKILGIGPSGINWKDYKHVQHGQRSPLKSESSKNQTILYGAAKMYKHYIMGTRYLYNWTKMMVDMVLDKIVHNDRETLHARILNSCI